VSPVLEVPSLIVRELTVAEATSNVTVVPLAIITSSLAVGTYPHDQVAAMLHNPIPVEVHTAAEAVETGNPAAIRIMITMAAMNFVFEEWKE
jgi:hypothetical protein